MSATPTVSTELVRTVMRQPPSTVIDYRDSRIPGFVLRARPSGVHSWRVQLPNRSWLMLGRLDEVTLADARKAAQDSRAHAALGHVLPTKKPKSTVTLRKFIDTIYLPWMRATYTEKTEQPVRLRAAFAPLLDLQLSELTAARVERWRAERRPRLRNARQDGDRPAVKRSTVNRNLSALKAALSRAVEWGYLSEHPLPRLKRGKEDETAVVRYLSSDEERRLRATLEQRDKVRRDARDSANAWRSARSYELWPAYETYTDHLAPLILIALNTGLRRGELFNLQWCDVHLDKAFITVAGARAKTGQTRHVPLNSEALAILREWAGADASSEGFVFPGGEDGAPLRDVKKGWLPLLKKAKIEGFRFHDLRHTFASKLVMAGVDLNTVRELLGHSDIKMTLRYAHLAPEHKAAAVERLVSAER